MALQEADSGPALGDLLTVHEIAEALGRHPETIYIWIRKGRLAVVNPGREFVIRKEDLERCLANPE